MKPVKLVMKSFYDKNERQFRKKLSNAQFRKVRKFFNEPKQFFIDMTAKYERKVKKYLPIKYNGHFQYTVVSAIYNVDKYLDEYFRSLVNQSLNFKQHIQLILVDDGSTDNSAKIIKEWQKKYPKNIHYYHKENGGQASARNLGLKYVETEWVTFIDPDDFVNVDYFKNIDEILFGNNNIKMLVANTIFYIESNSSLRDTHPLRYRFHQKEKKFPIKNLNKNINLSVAASVFATKVILDNQIIFDNTVKPNFEDGKFIGEFLLHADSGDVWFADNVIYNYRKRDDSSSTLDTAWLKPEKYSNVLENGFVSLLTQYKEKFASVPTNIQMTALYDMYWYLVYLLNQSEKIDFLAQEQKQKYYQLYDEVMQFIDASTIMDFSMAGAWFFHKVGFLGAFKGEKPPFQICYIESIDKIKQQILISYFDYFDEPVSYLLDDMDTVPKYQKNVINTFNDKLFVYEKRVWIGYTSLTQTLKINIYGKPARLALSNFAHKPEYTIADIEKAFTSPKYSSDGSWLLMDRETKADDNAEHLYRYLQKNHPEQRCYFALNRDSGDWDRLQADGFNLVAFGESDFELRLANCDKIISSHIEAHIHNYFGDLYAGTKQFIFLQHGVTKDNLSRWLNGKKHVAMFVTTTKDEYQSIALGEQYKFGQKEVVLTGFPRHDELYRKNLHDQNNKTILIMPTWRSYLMGETIGKGANTRTLNPKFLTSTYATHWLSLLRSEQLKSLVDNYGYQVIFAPHANIEPYLAQMDLPKYLTICSASQSDVSMQELFVNASLLVTDYSSVAFEMAYIGKPTLYYQFDKDEFFSGSHSYQKGYFDYEQHGFGAVCYDEQSLLLSLEDVLKNGIAEEYQYRINNTFEYQDDRNCERVYQAIKALDEPDTNIVNLDILKEMVDSAYKYQNWQLVIERATKLLEIEPNNQETQSLLVRAFIHSKQLDKVPLLLQTYQLHDNELLFLTALARYNWQQAVDIYPKLSHPTFENTYGYLNALIKLGQNNQAIECIKSLLQDELSKAQKTTLSLMMLDLQGQYETTLSLIDDVVLMSNDELSVLKPQLLLARAYREIGEYDLAHQQLVNFEKHTGNDTDCCLEIAKLAFAREHYGKCIDQYEKLMNLGYLLTDVEQKQYLDSMFLTAQYDKFLLYVDKYGIIESEAYQQQIIQVLAHQKQWQRLNELFVAKPVLKQTMIYEYALSQVRLGKFDKLDKAFPKPIYGDTYEYWRLMADIAMLNDNIALQKYCYKGMVAMFPERDRQKNLVIMMALK